MESRNLMSDVPYLSLILACYNEAPHLKWSVREIIRVMDHTPYSYELIFVDDCSGDDTRLLIKEIIAEYSPGHNMRLLFHEENTGRGGAVNDGVRLARGAIVGFLDIDLSVHPHYIPAMIWAIEDGYDIAMALRIYPLKIGENIFRHVLSHGYRLLTKLLLKNRLQDTEAGFKFFRRNKIMPVLETVEDKGWFWDTEIMLRSYHNNLRIIEIPCLDIKKINKKSTVRIFRDTWDYLIKLRKFKRNYIDKLEKT